MEACRYNFLTQILRNAMKYVPFIRETLISNLQPKSVKLDQDKSQDKTMRVTQYKYFVVFMYICVLTLDDRDKLKKRTEKDGESVLCFIFRRNKRKLKTKRMTRSCLFFMI
jgi:hypothetical protein